MILIRTKHLLPEGYVAMTVWPVVFYNKEYPTPETIEHERCHLRQQVALLWLPFFVLYLIFYLIGLVRYRNHFKAYYNIPFERAARRFERNPAPHRGYYTWLREIRKK